MSLLEYNIMKARHGRYADTAENRRLHRVGQEYGHAGQEEQGGEKKTGKGEDGKEKRTYDTARKELSAVLSHKDEYISKYGEDEYNKRVGGLVAEAKQLSDDEHKAAADKDFDKLKQPEKPKDTRSKKEKRTERLAKYKEQLKKVQDKMNEEGASEESKKMGEALEAKWKAKIEKLEAKVNRGKKKEASSPSERSKKEFEARVESAYKEGKIDKDSYDAWKKDLAENIFKQEAEAVNSGRVSSQEFWDDVNSDLDIEIGKKKAEAEPSKSEESEEREKVVKAGSFPDESTAIEYENVVDKNGATGTLRIDKDEHGYWLSFDYKQKNGLSGHSGAFVRSGEDYLKNFPEHSEAKLIIDQKRLEENPTFSYEKFRKASLKVKTELKETLEKMSLEHEGDYDSLKKYVKKFEKDREHRVFPQELLKEIQEKVGLGDEGSKSIADKLVMDEYSRLKDLLKKKKSESKGSTKGFSKGEKVIRGLKNKFDKYSEKLERLHDSGIMNDDDYEDIKEDLDRWYEDYGSLFDEAVLVSSDSFEDFKSDVEEAESDFDDNLTDLNSYKG